MEGPSGGRSLGMATRLHTMCQSLTIPTPTDPADLRALLPLPLRLQLRLGLWRGQPLQLQLPQSERQCVACVVLCLGPRIPRMVGAWQEWEPGCDPPPLVVLPLRSRPTRGPGLELWSLDKMAGNHISAVLGTWPVGPSETEFGGVSAKETMDRLGGLRPGPVPV